MISFDEQDKKLLYVVRTTVKRLMGSWADCEMAYNRLAKRPRAQDALSRLFNRLNQRKMRKETSTSEWTRTRAQVETWLSDVSGLRCCEGVTDLIIQRAASPFDERS